MHCFNATSVLINRVNCSGNTFILTLDLEDMWTLSVEATSDQLKPVKLSIL